MFNFRNIDQRKLSYFLTDNIKGFNIDNYRALSVNLASFFNIDIIVENLDDRFLICLNRDNHYNILKQQQFSKLYPELSEEVENWINIYLEKEHNLIKINI